MNKKGIAIIIGVVVLTAIAVVLFVFLRNPEYKVSFDSVGGSVVETQNIAKDKTAKKPSNPTKTGYVFDNWYLNNEVFDFNTPITKNIKLIAKWIKNDSSDGKEKFVVSFDTDGGSVISPITVEQNGKITKPTDPTKDGYKFVSWQVDGADFDFNVAITKNIKLVAKWEKQATDNNSTKPNTNKPTTISVSGIDISKTTLNLKVGENANLTATVSPNNATNKSIAWTSSNNAVATVDANGKVVAVGDGTATITATAGNKKATCTVTVIREVTYSIDWVKVAESSIGQYTLYIKSSEGNYVSGKAEVTTVSGKKETVDVPTTGLMYIKSAVANATVKSID